LLYLSCSFSVSSPQTDTSHSDCGAEWSGINALLYYGPTLVQSIGLNADTVGLVVSGGIGVVMFLAVVPAILYIDRLGQSLPVLLTARPLTLPKAGSHFFEEEAP
jgi:hypothetical protein